VTTAPAHMLLCLAINKAIEDVIIYKYK